MNKTVYFPNECSELCVSDISTLSKEALEVSHNIPNNELVECGKATWFNGCVYGYVKGALTILIPVAGITTVCLIKKAFKKNKKEGK